MPVIGPISWLMAGSEGGGGSPVPPALPEAAVDPLWGAYAPEDADTVLADFGALVTVEALGTVRILHDVLHFVDDEGAPVQTARGYRLARIKRGAFNGAALGGRVVTVSNGVTQATFKLIGPVQRPSSLFDHYVMEPRRREVAA